MTLLRRWLLDDRGQDLVEYVLLGVTVALAGVVAMNLFGPIMNAVYLSWGTESLNLWYPQDPAP